METFDEKLARVLKEEIDLVPYNPLWKEMFDQERKHLTACLPERLIGKIEHFGSTAVPDLPAKPIIDILVEVTSLDETKKTIAPILELQGYDYFWRPSFGDSTPPFYAWFIKRDKNGLRTHHIHMVEADFEHWERLLFRDYLLENEDIAKKYGALKTRLCNDNKNDRVAYTMGKTEFIVATTEEAKKHYPAAQHMHDR